MRIQYVLDQNEKMMVEKCPQEWLRRSMALP
jgi:hypothetical protein